MSQLPKIPASAYTPEMNTLGVIRDITTFEGERVPVSYNPLIPGTRPLQLLPLPGTEFPVRYETSGMRNFQTEVDLGKARAGESSTNASAFWDLLDPPMCARVVTADFGDYAVGLHRTQPQFPPAMRYMLMERWNDCTHTFIFGFGEMTLTPADYTTITGLGFDGPVAPLDSRYQTAALGTELVRTLLGVTTQTRNTAQECVPTRGSGESSWQFIRPLEVWAYEYRIYPGGLSGDTPADSRRIPRYLAHCHHTFSSSEDPHYWRCFMNDRALSDEGEAWRTYPAREVAEFYTRSRFLLRGYWLDRYLLRERVYEIQVATAQRRVPQAPSRHMYLLEGPAAKGSGVHLGDSLERKKHQKPAYYRAEAEAEAEAEAAALAGPVGAVLGDVPFPPGMEVALDPGLGLESAIIIPNDLRQAPPPLQLDPEHATYMTQRYQELCRRFGFARSYIAQLYSERIGRLWRHQSRQSSAVTRLQLEVDRLRTRLEVAGVPLDISEDEEDDDGSSSDDAPPSPPPQAAAGPSWRHR
ncbi:hypothetical protein JCGZ_16943 [Jatropha curcas]|uniref:Aminotransferase-like plant mobile domain-containing protein n=1 Tax=Jatropha curcas TaxID=180498 RepID=A0A067K395_JATCU|nr:hypothetical protein JCGZ_16943 [Jatropha curcas]